MQGQTAPARSEGRFWDQPVDQDRFALARLAVQTERYREARARLQDLLDGKTTPLQTGGRDEPQSLPLMLAPVPFRINEPPTVRDACLLMAESLYMVGRYDECVSYCARAMAAQQLPPDEIYVDLLHGWVLKRRAQLLPARDLAHRNLKRNERRANPCVQAGFLHLRGMCDFSLGRHEAAMRDLRDAVALYRLAKQWGGVSEVLNALATVEKISGRLPASIGQFEEAKQLNDKLGCMMRKAKNLWNLSYAYVKAGQPDKALRLLDRAEQLQKERECLQTQLNFRVARAKTYLQMGRLEEARRMVTPALGQASQSRFIREEELALETLGDLALLEGRLTSARRYFERAMALAQRVGAKSDLVAGVLRRLGEVTLAEGDPCRAVAVLRKAVRAARTCCERYEEGISYRILAAAYRTSKQRRRAYAAIRKSITVLRDFGAELELAHSQLEAARIRLELWQAGERVGEGDHDDHSHDGAYRSSNLEVAWSYVIEAFHGYGDLGREEQSQECIRFMEDMRTRAKIPWLSQSVKIAARQVSVIVPEGGGVQAGKAERAATGGQAGKIDRETFVASSPVMRQVLQLIRIAAASREPVLITGETGTGKELIARLIHDGSGGGPFVPVNCGAIPDTLFEREFFGNRQGAYTGADSDKAGFCELADGGTLLLDEIGEMPLYLQVKLLRLLQEGTFRRLGDPEEQQVDLRVIACTNAGLKELIDQRLFRQDLFFRLQTLEVQLPPLRERAEDIDPLLELFVGRACGDGVRPADLFAEDVLAALRRYPWPGNVRELESMTRRLALLAAHAGRATTEMLPPEIARWRDGPSGAISSLSLARYLERAERERIVQALTQTEGNRTEAARALGISRNTLYKKMERLGIRIPA